MNKVSPEHCAEILREVIAESERESAIQTEYLNLHDRPRPLWESKETTASEQTTQILGVDFNHYFEWRASRLNASEGPESNED